MHLKTITNSFLCQFTLVFLSQLSTLNTLLHCMHIYNIKRQFFILASTLNYFYFTHLFIFFSEVCVLLVSYLYLSSLFFELFFKRLTYLQFVLVHLFSILGWRFQTRILVVFFFFISWISFCCSVRDTHAADACLIGSIILYIKTHAFPCNFFSFLFLSLLSTFPLWSLNKVEQIFFFHKNSYTVDIQGAKTSVTTQSYSCYLLQRGFCLVYLSEV